MGFERGNSHRRMVNLSSLYEYHGFVEPTSGFDPDQTAVHTCDLCGESRIVPINTPRRVIYYGEAWHYVCRRCDRAVTRLVGAYSKRARAKRDS